MKKIILLLLVASVQKGYTQNKTLAVMPFMLEKSCIYIYCKVNDTDSMKFLFDTGADGSVINSNSIQKVNLTIDGESKNIGSNGSNMVGRSMSNTIAFGTVVKTQVPLTIIPYETQAFDGVFGTDLMRGFIIGVDYDRKQLIFYDAAGYKPEVKRYERIRLHFVNNYPCVKSKLHINGKTYSGFFGLDTGADNAITIAAPFVRKNNFLAETKKIAVASYQGSDGSTYSLSIIALPEISLGKKLFYNVPAALSVATEGTDATNEMKGFFGNDFLKRFNLVIDLENGYLYVEPGTNLHAPYFE